MYILNCFSSPTFWLAWLAVVDRRHSVGRGRSSPPPRSYHALHQLYRTDDRCFAKAIAAVNQGGRHGSCPRNSPVNSFLTIVGRGLATDTEDTLEVPDGYTRTLFRVQRGTNAIKNRMQGCKHLPLGEIIPQMPEDCLSGWSLCLNTANVHAAMDPTAVPPFVPFGKVPTISLASDFTTRI